MNSAATCQRLHTPNPSSLGKHRSQRPQSHGVMTQDSMHARHGGTFEHPSSEKIPCVRNASESEISALPQWSITSSLGGWHQSLSWTGPTCSPFARPVTIGSQVERGGVVKILKNGLLQTVEVSAVHVRAKLRTFFWK